MLINCLAVCAHLTITVSEIERDIGENNGRKAGFFHTPLYSTPPLGGSRRNIGTPFGMENQNGVGYPMVKNFEDMFIRFDMIHECDRRTDRRTDRHRMTAQTALASRGKNKKTSGGLNFGLTLQCISTSPRYCFDRQCLQRCLQLFHHIYLFAMLREHVYKPLCETFVFHRLPAQLLLSRKSVNLFHIHVSVASSLSSYTSVCICNSSSSVDQLDAVSNKLCETII